MKNNKRKKEDYCKYDDYQIIVEDSRSMIKQKLKNDKYWDEVELSQKRQVTIYG